MALMTVDSEETGDFRTKARWSANKKLDGVAEVPCPRQTNWRGSGTDSIETASAKLGSPLQVTSQYCGADLALRMSCAPAMDLVDQWVESTRCLFQRRDDQRFDLVPATERSTPGRGSSCGPSRHLALQRRRRLDSVTSFTSRRAKPPSDWCNPLGTRA
jgi:hypothetical protein